MGGRREGAYKAKTSSKTRRSEQEGDGQKSAGKPTLDNLEGRPARIIGGRSPLQVQSGGEPVREREGRQVGDQMARPSVSSNKIHCRWQVSKPDVTQVEIKFPRESSLSISSCNSCT